MWVQIPLMPMINNLSIPIYWNLINIKGINKHKAKLICETIGISTTTKLNRITTNKQDTLNALLTGLKKTNPGIDHELIRNIKTNINNLININAYRGRRHKHHLPTRGQRTRTNARTAKRSII